MFGKSTLKTCLRKILDRIFAENQSISKILYLFNMLCFAHRGFSILKQSPENELLKRKFNISSLTCMKCNKN